MVYFYGNEPVGAGAFTVCGVSDSDCVWGLQEAAAYVFDLFDFLLFADILVHMAHQRRAVYVKRTAGFYACRGGGGKKGKVENSCCGDFGYGDDALYGGVL